jgi:predicted nuclease of restriction endonuclease-like RecB superfamily
MREIDICANQYGKFFNDVRFENYAIEQAVKINNIWTKVYVSKKFSKRQRHEMREHILELAKNING